MTGYGHSIPKADSISKRDRSKKRDSKTTDSEMKLSCPVLHVLNDVYANYVTTKNHGYKRDIGNADVFSFSSAEPTILSLSQARRIVCSADENAGSL